MSSPSSPAEPSDPDETPVGDPTGGPARPGAAPQPQDVTTGRPAPEAAAPAEPAGPTRVLRTIRSDDDPAPGAVDGAAARRRRPRGLVWAATLLMAALSFGYLVVTPSFYAADEIWHFDRVMAASHGDVLVTPGEFRLSVGSATAQPLLLANPVSLGLSNLATGTAPERSQRPTYNSVGGNSRPDTAPTNYMSQHPPLYYALLGGVTALIPGADDLPVDQLLFLLRAVNILLLLPLPLLFARAARRLVGPGVVADAAAFLPLLVPGVLRGAGTVNNDNLSILIGAAAVLCAVRIATGDRTLRTALWAAGMCLAASLTKGTVLLFMLVVPGAYVVQLIRSRRWPPPAVLVTLGVGAVLSAAWWVANKILYGKVLPDGASPEQAVGFGAPRAPGDPMDMGRFWYKALIIMPSRFWGSLGVLEPPAPPVVLVVVLSVLALLASLLSFVLLRGHRWEVLLLWAQVAVFAASVLYVAYGRYRDTVGIPGLQGRYYYPALFAMVFPLVLVIGWALRRAARFTVAVTAAVGLVLSVWFVLIMFGWLYYPDRHFSLGGIGAAARRMISWGPFPGSVAAVLVVVIAVVGVLGLVATVRGVLRQPPTDAREQYREHLAAEQASTDPATGTPDGDRQQPLPA